MKTEVRFVLAIGLMLLVLVGTNLLFPPTEPPPVLTVDTVEAPAPSAPSVLPGLETGPPPEAEVQEPVAPALPAAVTAEEREVVVEGPLYRFAFTTLGARLRSAELLGYISLREGNGPVQLLPDGVAALGSRIVVAQDTLDLREVPFEVQPAEGLRLSSGGGPRELRFTYTHPSGRLELALVYTFRPDGYVVDVEGHIAGLDRSLFVTDLGVGLAFNEADSEVADMAYVRNHVAEGIDATQMDKVDEPEVRNGPFRWVALKSKFFLTALLPGSGEVGDSTYLGGLLLSPRPEQAQAGVAAVQAAGTTPFRYRLFLGPQERDRLGAMGDDFAEVSPIGYKFLRPVLRPITAAILWVLNFLHDNLRLGYGWVLVVFGISMRVVLWPLNQKAMRAQMRNMAVQPLVKEIQTKYKDNPERMQKEMMRLYKEYGFNPVAGCLPMLLPFPVLIALFFVFRSTITLRGVPFYWLTDLSAKDPLFLLPLFLAVSMFALQFISLRSMPQSNPQMKMMMWFMPFFMGFIFMNFPSGLNLYYATANIATIPQQLLIARERKKAAGKGPVKLSDSKT